MYFIFALFASSVCCVVEAILVLKHLFIKGPNTDVLRALYEDVFWMSVVNIFKILLGPVHWLCL